MVNGRSLTGIGFFLRFHLPSFLPPSPFFLSFYQRKERKAFIFPPINLPASFYPVLTETTNCSICTLGPAPSHLTWISRLLCIFHRYLSAKPFSLTQRCRSPLFINIILQLCLRGPWPLQIPGLHKRLGMFLCSVQYARPCCCFRLKNLTHSYFLPPWATSMSIPPLLSGTSFSRSVTRDLLPITSSSLPILTSNPLPALWLCLPVPAVMVPPCKYQCLPWGKSGGHFSALSLTSQQPLSKWTYPIS